MPKSATNTRDFFAHLTDPPVLAQLFAVLIALLVAVAAGSLFRAWYRKRRGATPGVSFTGRIVEAVIILAPILVMLALLAGTRVVFDSLDMENSIIDRVLQLAAALVLVRLAVYVLRQLLG